jgi:hypothetical protein
LRATDVRVHEARPDGSKTSAVQFTAVASSNELLSGVEYELASWAEEGKPLRLVQQSVAKDDLEPKAISCYEPYLPEIDQTWLRFVDGRPVNSITTQFLQWSCEKLQAAGKKVLLLIWDNANWHISKEVRRWLGQHNRRVKNSGCGVRIISCLLPKQRARGLTP